VTLYHATFLHHRLNQIKHCLVVGWATVNWYYLIVFRQPFNLIHLWDSPIEVWPKPVKYQLIW